MNQRFALYGFLGAIALGLVLSSAGCGAAPIRSSAAPITLGAVHTDDSSGVCDTYRARFQRTPLTDSAGNPVWCF